MKGSTHLIFGAGLGCVVAINGYSGDVANAALLTGATILGSLLPDIDVPNSKISKKVNLLSMGLNKMFGHRGFFHSPLFVVSMYLLFTFLCNRNGWTDWIPVVNGFVIGLVGHLWLDMFTKGGIPLFYPFLRKHFSFARMASGSRYELLMMVFAGVLGCGVYFGGLYIYNILAEFVLELPLV